jgi:hypothetical protein
VAGARSAYGLTESQVAELDVDSVSVNTAGVDNYLLVDCTTPAITGVSDVVRFVVALDQPTALRILFNAPLDESRLPRVRRTRVDTTAPTTTGVGARPGGTDGRTRS